MNSRIAVWVHAADVITKHGLSAQLRTVPELRLLETEDPELEMVTVAAVDTIDQDALAQLRAMRHRGHVRVVLIAGRVDDGGLLAAVEAGVTVVLLRAEATPAAVARAVARAQRGEAALPADALSSLLKHMSRLQQNVLSPRGLTVSGLSTRESEVLRLVADGCGTSEIAEKLSYSTRTVKSILHDITVRFCLRNRSHAVAYALREGLI